MGVRCIHLDDQFRYDLFGHLERPEVWGLQRGFRITLPRCHGSNAHRVWVDASFQDVRAAPG